ncbi:MAG: rhomboid family intramembrane serine protease [Conexivisphaerales archaeon]
MVSKQGRDLILLIFLGLVIGFIASAIRIDGLPSVYFLVQSNALVLIGYVWPLLTSMIVVLPNYLGLTDVVFNAVSVLFVDSLLAPAFNYREYFAIFFISGLAGNVASLLNGPNIISFGASGGIFGLVAAAVTHDFAFHGRVNAALLGWFVIIFIFNTFSSVYVDWLAHSGGALIGLVLGYLVGRRHRRFAYWSAYQF